MSDHAKPKKTPKPPQAFGWIAEYADENQLLDAARQVRDSGYTRTDAFTPFPVHGIDEALGIKPTVLPWFTLCAGFHGITVARDMQWGMNAVDYPFMISGKPMFGLPAAVPVMFELTVLLSAFACFFGMWGLNGMPRLSHPLLAHDRFRRASQDRFYIVIESRDPKFAVEKTRAFLASLGGSVVDEVRESVED